jgi:hypothetical protein
MVKHTAGTMSLHRAGLTTFWQATSDFAGVKKPARGGLWRDGATLLVEGVFDVPDDLVGFAFALLLVAFDFLLTVVGHFSNLLLKFTGVLFYAAFDLVFVHGNSSQ